MSLGSLIMSGVQIIAGIFLTMTGIGGALGLKLILSGALTLVSGLLNAKTGRDGFASSPTYGFDNLSNGAREGAPVPVVYGTHVIAPTLISTNLISEGGKQVLLLLLAVCEGEIQSLSNVRLNDTAMSSFAGVSATTDRLGTSSQSTITDFGQTGIAYGAGTRLPKLATHVHEGKGAADEIVLAFVWPGGLYKRNTNGGIGQGDIGVKIEWKATGAADASYKPFLIPAGRQGDWYTDGTAGIWKTSATTTSPLRRQCRLQFDSNYSHPPRGQYVIRVTGTNDDSGTFIIVPTLATVIEIVGAASTYANTALLAIKAPASEQLNGSMPRVTVEVKGRKVYDPRTGTTAWSRNPVLCVRDLLLDSRYGLGQWLVSADIDDGVGGTWRTVADACDTSVTNPDGSSEARWQLDYVMDVKSPIGDHLTQMLTTFRATIYQADGKIRIAQDTTGTSARTFEDRVSASTRRNVVTVKQEDGQETSSLTVRSLEANAAWNIVRVRYVDRDRLYKQRLLEVRNYSIPIGSETGTPVAGEKFKGATSKAIGRYIYSRSGVLYFTQDYGATAFQSGETLTFLTSGATAATTSTATTAESPEHALEINLYGVTRRSQAIREARYHLNRAQITPIFASWAVFWGDLDVLPGDIVEMYSDWPNYATAKNLTVLSVSFDMQGFGRIDAREYDTAVYVDTVDTTLPDPTVALTEAGGTLDSGIRALSGAGGAGGSAGSAGSSSTRGFFGGNTGR